VDPNPEAIAWYVKKSEGLGLLSSIESMTRHANAPLGLSKKLSISFCPAYLRSA
jgi:hypothetical protein